MKNRTVLIIIFGGVLTLFIAIGFHNVIVSHFKNYNQLHGKIELLRNANADLNLEVLNSSAFLYHNLDRVSNNIKKIDAVLDDFKKEDIFKAKNSPLLTKLNSLRELFNKKETAVHNFQKANSIIKNSTMYLSILLSKGQMLFDDKEYLDTITQVTSNIFLAKYSGDKDLLSILDSSTKKMEQYKFTSKEQEEFNQTLLLHIKVYETFFYDYISSLKETTDTKYDVKIEEFSDVLYEEFNKKLLFINVFPSTMMILFILSLAVIIYLIQKIEKEHLENKDKLEQRVKEEVEKNREKEKLLFKQARMAQLGEMLANIAHQWRQPLSVITASVSGMKLSKEMGTLNDNEFNEFYIGIINNAKYLSQTIDDFRNFVKEKKDTEYIILQDKIRNTVSIMDASLRNNYIELITHTPKEPITVNLVSGELTQVMMNIINNAKDILKDLDKEEKWIKIVLTKEDKSALITIEDNGGGIPEDILPKIFNPYFTTKHESMGTGLGLYMSYEIVLKSLKGKLYAKNTKNGAKFFITLPID